MASDNDEAQELIRWAEDAIGNDEPEDYRIHPTDFPNTLQESAPKLADFLRNAALTETAKRFLARDNEAVRLQAAFERISSRVTWAIFAATVSGAVLASLSSVPGDPTWWLRAIFFMLGLCAMGAGALAAAGLHRVRSGGLLSEWMSSRAAAESERLGYFNKALSAIMKGGGDDASVCLLFLEFFRRYQMAVQQLYYRDRRTQHVASRDKTGNIGAVAVFVLFLGSGGFGLVAAFQPEVLPLAALGTVGAALAAVAARREELGQDGTRRDTGALGRP